MKSIYILISYLVLVVVIICCEKMDDSYIVTENGWRLSSVKIDDETYSVIDRNLNKKASYHLDFSSDSSFSFGTSVNSTYGIYKINNIQIDIMEFYVLTQMANSDEVESKIDELIEDYFIGMFNHNLNFNRLLISNNNIVFSFKKDNF